MSKNQIGFQETKQLLNNYDISVPGAIVQDAAELLATAEQLGYPVVIKGISAQIIHKSDVGCVFLNLHDQESLKNAYEQLLVNVHKVGVTKLDGILIQPMVKNGLEILVGAKQDPAFGPVVMVGLGGKNVELLADVALGVGILTRDDVLDMLAETKAGKILDGYRGDVFDKEAIIDLAMNVSRLMAEHPEVHELDLNPVIVYADSISIVDTRIIQGEAMVRPQPNEHLAEKLKSLQAIFSPQSVAIVGASRPGTMGGIILKNSMRIDKIFPVHPRLKNIQGLTCYPSLSSLPEIPDVGVFAINAEETVRCFEEFCKMGGKGAIIFSDGFAESGRSDLEDRLVALSEQYNVAYIGPNCMGLIDNFTGLNTFYIPAQRTSAIDKANGIGIISQSGGVSLELKEMLRADEINLGQCVSCGNASSVSVTNILAHMGDDPRIKIIAIYLEGVDNGYEFMEVSRQVALKKPIIAIKGGAGGGAAATLSHTATLAGSHEAFRAACRQAGIYLLEELTEDTKVLVNILSILTTQPAAYGNRVGIVSVGGGSGILLADQVTAVGLPLTTYAPQTQEKLRALISDNMGSVDDIEKNHILQGIGGNPIDLFGNCCDERLIDTLRIIDEDPNTDIILSAIYFQVPTLSEYLPEKLADLRAELKKPLIVSPRGFSEYISKCRQYLYSKKFHTYTVPMMQPMAIALDIWDKYKISFCDTDSE
ncbi:MAG: acetate--CoA ligase family protein [Desulfuromonas sp.]|nr:acetate--CoA ligase family protein [Desulfuromonas sp.]